MVLMPPARLLRSATKALPNSIANTAVSSASRPCGTFGQFFPQMFRNSNWSIVSESGHGLHPQPQACAFRLMWSEMRKRYQDGSVEKSVIRRSEPEQRFPRPLYPIADPEEPYLRGRRFLSERAIICLAARCADPISFRDELLGRPADPP